jgi:membrane-associated protein
MEKATATPWQGRATREDKIILVAFAASGIVPLAMLPLVPVLVASHPELLELLRGSTASVVNMGARARVGEASIVAAVLLGVPSLMLFDWAYWWAGRRWGDRVFVWLLGGQGPRTERRLARLHRLEARFGPAAVVLAYFQPLPTGVVYAAVGDGGMRLWVFLLLDALGTMLWTGVLAFLGWQLGHAAIDVADAVARYGLWATIGLVVAIIVWRSFRIRRSPRP